MRKRFGDFAESELSIKPGGDGGNGHLTPSQGSSRKHRGRSRETVSFLFQTYSSSKDSISCRGLSVSLQGSEKGVFDKFCQFLILVEGFEALTPLFWKCLSSTDLFRGGAFSQAGNHSHVVFWGTLAVIGGKQF